MRICHGLLGDSVEVEDQELQWRKPLDIVRLQARERWGVDAEDIIVLASGGVAVGPACGAEDLGRGIDVFLFLRSNLAPQADPAVAEISGHADEEEVDVAEAEAEEAEPAPQWAGAASSDPAFGAFRSNIVEARRRLAEVRPVVSVAVRFEARLEIQRLAAQAVLDNLTSHRATCSRSMTLFLQKYQRVQERLDQNLGKVEDSLAALRAVPLHPALVAAGRECLADAVPHERILRFTAGLQAEKSRLAQRLDKLRQQDTQAQALCEQVAGKVQQLLQDDTVHTSANTIRQQHARATGELLPALQVQVPQEGAEPAFVLEEEKRSAGALEGLCRACEDIRQELGALRACWERQRVGFLQRLREVSYIQSKVRGVERQAALLEEEINVQHNHSQQLNHLQKMPRAYQQALGEVGRRRQFRARFLAQAEQSRGTLARMMEDENARRRGFVRRYGCHLPADLVRGLGTLVPPASVEVPDFDAQLPDLGLPPGSPSQAAAEAGGGGASSSASGRPRSSLGSAGATAGGAAAAAAAAKARERTSSTSSGSSSLPPAASSGRGGTGSLSGGSGAGGPGGSSGGSQGQAGSSSQGPAATTVAALAAIGNAAVAAVGAGRHEELQARNRALEARVEVLLSELAAQQQQHHRQLEAAGGEAHDVQAAPAGVPTALSTVTAEAAAAGCGGSGATGGGAGGGPAEQRGNGSEAAIAEAAPGAGLPRSGP